MALLAAGATAAGASSGLRGTPLSLLSQLWWVIPLCLSLASLIALATSAAFSRVGGARRWAEPLAGAYLVSGPSLGALNIFALLSLGVSPPPWVGVLMLSFLLCSALIYYDTIKEQDQSQGKGSRREPAFTFLGPRSPSE